MGINKDVTYEANHGWMVYISVGFGIYVGSSASYRLSSKFSNYKLQILLESPLELN
jgi:hypothetical protein